MKNEEKLLEQYKILINDPEFDLVTGMEIHNAIRNSNDIEKVREIADMLLGELLEMKTQTRAKSEMFENLGEQILKQVKYMRE